MATKKPPEAFGPTARLEKEYASAIRAITGRVLLSTKKLPGESFTEWLAKLAARSQQPDITAASELLAKRMVFSANTTNERTWRAAAAKSSQSRQLYAALQNEMRGATGARVAQLVRENASYISSLPLVSAQTVTDEILKAQQAGARPSTLSKLYQRRFPELLRSRIHLISRTESARASTALTQARCESLNLDWFEWETSQDKRTRTSHKNLNGVLCSWSDLPSPERLVGEKDYGRYPPGGTFNCRCVPAPLLSITDVSWPRRVYHAGSIHQMTLVAFKKIARIEEPIAA